MDNKSLLNYINDINNSEKNYKLALEYEKLGQTGSAISFFLRAAELTKNDLLAYECMIKIGLCFEKQGNRTNTVKSAYHNAITIMPSRPEAYFYLSKILEFEGMQFDAYTFSKIGLETYKNNIEELYLCGYPGKYGLLFQKAVNSWWRGNCMESRKILQILIDEHWDEMDDYYKSMVEKNVTTLGAGPADYVFKMYDPSKYNLLRYKFKDSEKIQNNHSQVYQDMFVLSMLKGKRNGSFLEIGGGDPYFGNNTCLLEKMFDWKGVSFEYNEYHIEHYRKERPNTNLFHKDALDIDYKDFLSKNFETKEIDYLQLDIEPSLRTYECLLKIPFDEYKFAVITFEHDYYVDVTRSVREKSREYLKSKGYVLVAGNIAAVDKCTFEDWWVHPDLVDKTVLQKMMQDNDDIKLVEDYMLCGEKNIMFSINNNSNKTVFIVDNYYENPEEVREFALDQTYIEGGLGRGFIGKRTEQQFLFPGLKESFEQIMGKKITKWEEHGMNGRFQINISGEPKVYHCDSQKYAAMIYLTPNAPFSCGTTLLAHKKTRARNFYEEGWDVSWKDVPGDPHLDGTDFEPVDVIGNVYNRLAIFDASSIHSASEYFGTVDENARLWHMFFFDAE